MQKNRQHVRLQFTNMYLFFSFSIFIPILIIHRSPFANLAVTVIRDSFFMDTMIPFSSDDVCDIPRNLSVPQICDYFANECTVLRYIHLRYYYCSQVNHPLVSNIVLWSTFILSIALLFLILGLLASDFLVPNLSALSGALKMDEKLAGLTLLAFANGSPDILSTYIAMHQGLTSMAVGELLGSANFALTVVIGVLSIYRPFKVNQTYFMIDLFVFSVLIFFSLWILSDGIITLSESIILCVLYVVFIMLNFFLPNGELVENFGITDRTSSMHLLTQENINTFLTPEDVNLNGNNDNDNTSNRIDNTHVLTNQLGQLISDYDNNSTHSNESTGSFNDYYFAHNVDNLEQGRGYKIALLDSLKLARLFNRKISSKNASLDNVDIERLHNIGIIDEESPLNSLETSQTIDPSNLLQKSTQNIENYSTTTSTNHPILSRIETSKRIKSKDDYQILYPNKSFQVSRVGSSWSLTGLLGHSNSRQSSPVQRQHHDQPKKSVPVISIGDYQETIESIVEPRNENEDYIEGTRPTIVYPVHYEGDENRENDESNNNGISREDGLNSGTTSSPVLNTLKLPSPMVKDHSSTSSLIPYVEYQKTTNLFAKLCPTHIFTGALSLSETLLAIIIIPMNTIFNLIIPVPVPEELQGEIYENEISLAVKLFHLQIGIFPIVLTDFDFSIPIIIAAITLPGLCILSDRYFHTYYLTCFPIISSIIGFLTVLELITFSASTIILLLKDLGYVYSLNESILGLTILSLGNSVGDVVTNLALAGLGRPLTGLHACFGSPLLYILLGIGSCSLIVQLTTLGVDKNIVFTVDRSLQLTALSIFTMIFFYIVALPLNGWIFQRWMGFVGVSLWVVVTLTNFVLHGHANTQVT